MLMTRFFIFLLALLAVITVEGQNPMREFMANNMTFEKVGDYPQPINLVTAYTRGAYEKQSKEDCLVGLADRERGVLEFANAAETRHQDYFSVDARWLANPALRADSYKYGWRCFRVFYTANGSGRAQLYKVTARDKTKYDAITDIPLYTVVEFGANTGFIGWDQNLNSPAASTPQCADAGDSWTCTGYVVVKTN
jgi:hypothetical protein